ncbi:hypothetical protein [Cellulomonas chengniuliangii]|uniref:Uncharacterized protein n=1 Tax=Cellulomonas chengniuliangii TaxID=2968084 RepID=A0ABY5KWV4_9CELL|nr:hypothetical protein [Cellulomonas chengniuliangii]MCC2309474.1 hypothetical protein [Cellulomonas chengniuliangii]UUI74967.1 hypothetical protein NP064_14460 [Cellulomonas chengniuliangii]
MSTSDPERPTPPESPGRPTTGRLSSNEPATRDAGAAPDVGAASDPPSDRPVGAPSDRPVGAVRGTTPTHAVGPAVAHDTAAPPATSAPVPHDHGTPNPREQTAPSPREQTAPEPLTEHPTEDEPHGAGFGGHLLGVLVGAVLSVFALVLLLLGQSRILGSDDPTVANGVGIVLVTLAVLLFATIAYLGVWTAALPITGGVVLTVIGGFYLYFPSAASDETLRLLATDASRTTVIYGVIASTVGVTFVVGVLLLAAGCALVVARRRGRALGVARERLRTP